MSTTQILKLSGFILVLTILGVGAFLLFPSQTPEEANALSGSGTNTVSPAVSEKNLNKETKILFVGDVMLARSIGDRILEGDDPFKHVKEKFSEYDLVIANLETSISDKGEKQPGKLYTFRAPVESIELLKNSGIDIVSLANNHVMDYKSEAFNDMTARLKSAGIEYFGGGANSVEAFAPLIYEINGMKFGFVGFNDIETSFTAARNGSGNAWFDENLMKASLIDAQKSSDIVIPFLHWGEEFKDLHNSRQEFYGKFFIDNGADIVVGAHPHVIQGSGVYKDKTIFYSLGNFVFDQMYLGAAKGDMLELVFQNKELKSMKLIKIQINGIGFPEIVE